MKFKNFWIYLFNIIVTIITVIIISAPYINLLNNVFYDSLNYKISPHKEILIAGIDSKSFEKFGPLPWNDDVLNDVLKVLDSKGAKVIAIDLDLYEVIKISENYVSLINTKNSHIVIKEDNGSSKKKDSRIHYSSSEIRKDLDGKVRSYIANEAESSFLSIIYSFFSSPGKKVIGKEIDFKYSSNEFDYISFADVYKNSIHKSKIKDKIVIIGFVNTNKWKSLETFKSPFGESYTEIELDANVLNSLLKEEYNVYIPYYIFTPFFIIANISFLFIYSDSIKKNFNILIGIMILFSLFGIAIFYLGFNWFFVQTYILLIINYLYFTTCNNWLEFKKNNLNDKSFMQYLISAYKGSSVLKRKKGEFEKRIMTVMFSDIRGFTNISELLPPDELTRLLNKYVESMTDIINENNGTVDKFLGDGILAYWNAPSYDANHQKNAVVTALKMLRKLTYFNNKYLKDSNIKFHIGVGVNTGEIRIGDLGGKQKSQYTVLGDNVNLASRLESLTKKYGTEIILSENVLNGHSGSSRTILYRLLDEVIVKGKSVPIKIYEPLLNSKKNLRIKVVYEKAFKLYQKGRFDDALEFFGLLEDDKPSAFMTERIGLVRDKKTSTWSGVWAWNEK
ncbi:adenylate/guanylate cyclase domain-containing protein [Candidatus Dojkabacteria bacterium]|nr:adenylate/guanylate cyclase domain-containing protein [Candidatus Dojkabacteria bacterium]